MEKLLAVSVGTDHHRFDRLVGWVGQWAAQHPTVKVVVQRGSAKEIPGLDCPEQLPHDDLRQLFADADVVVCHGGPSTVMDARQAGQLPVVVPRDPSYNEHVDGHQIAFAGHLKRHGLATVVQTKDQLFEAIDLGFSDSSYYRIDQTEHSLNGVMAFGEMLDQLLKTETTIAESPERESGQREVVMTAAAKETE